MKIIGRFSTVGFIGVGNMGEGMVANLRKNKINVYAYDLNQQKLENMK